MGDVKVDIQVIDVGTISRDGDRRDPRSLVRNAYGGCARIARPYTFDYKIRARHIAIVEKTISVEVVVNQRIKPTVFPQAKVDITDGTSVAAKISCVKGIRVR